MFKKGISEIDGLWLHEISEIDQSVTLYKTIRNPMKLGKEVNLYQIVCSKDQLAVYDVPTRRTLIEIHKDANKVPVVNMELKDAECVSIANPDANDKRNTKELLSLDSADMDFVIQFGWRFIVESAVSRGLIRITDEHYRALMAPASTTVRLDKLRKMKYQIIWLKQEKIGMKAIVEYLKNEELIESWEVEEYIAAMNRPEKRKEILNNSIRSVLKIKGVNEVIRELHVKGWDANQIQSEFQRQLNNDMSHWNIAEVSIEKIQNVIAKVAK